MAYLLMCSFIPAPSLPGQALASLHPYSKALSLA